MDIMCLFYGTDAREASGRRYNCNIMNELIEHSMY
jgi:hypothetical protein